MRGFLNWGLSKKLSPYTIHRNMPYTVTAKILDSHAYKYCRMTE